MRDFKTQQIQQQRTVTLEAGRWCEPRGCPGVCLGALAVAQQFSEGAGYGGRAHSTGSQRLREPDRWVLFRM